MSSRCEPVYIDGCLAWLHAAGGTRAALICPALGVEGLVLHRIAYDLACALQANGHPVLRLDYFGTGDSADSEAGENQVPLWTASVKAALAHLRAQPGVAEVVLIGFELGGLLAAQAAVELAAVELAGVAGLVLIGPPSSGRTYVRGLLARRSVAGNQAPPDPMDGSVKDLELNGFVYNSSTLEAIEALDVAKMARAPAPRVLILGHENWAPQERLRASFAAIGSTAVASRLPGYAELHWHSTFSALPADAFAQLSRWMMDLPPFPAAAPFAAPTTRSSIAGPGWLETPVGIGDDTVLRGVLCTPTSGQAALCVVILNHGANRHIGWGRMYVPLARQLARCGIATLRLDLAGLGDSDSRPGQPDRALYDTAYFDDVDRALDTVQALGFPQVALLGHCSGAYHAFHSAVRNKRVAALIIVNLALFFWTPGTSLMESEQRSAKRLGWYLSKVTDGATWKRLLAGKIDVWHIFTAFCRRLAHAWRLQAARVFFGNALGEDTIVGKFRALSRRGTRVLIIYSDNDGGLDELAVHCGRDGRRATELDGISLVLLHGADHNVSALSARTPYFDGVQRFLIEVRDQVHGAPAPMTASESGGGHDVPPALLANQTGAAADSATTLRRCERR